MLLVGLSLTALVVTAAAPAAANGPKTCNGRHRLCSRHFDQVVLPATHNSMSAASLDWRLPNQQVAMPAQLRAGVRGLLIDTHYGELRPDGVVVTDDQRVKDVGPRDLYLCHEYCEIGASPLVPQLRKIKKFVKGHPNNVLLIDVEDYITPNAFARAMRQSGLRRHLYTGDPGPRWPKLKTLIKRRQQVVVLTEHDGGTGQSWLHRGYDGAVQETPYTFQHRMDLTDPANWEASCVPNRGGTTGSLFLMNHWSPPTPPAQATPSDYEELNAKSVLVGRAKQCATTRGLLPTIVAVDQFSYGDLFGAVKRLNQLGGRTLQR